MTNNKADVINMYLSELDERMYLVDDFTEDEHAIILASEAYDLTNDPIFLEKKLLLLEVSGQYKHMAKVATELGDIERAQEFNKMQELVDANKPESKEDNDLDRDDIIKITADKNDYAIVIEEDEEGRNVKLYINSELAMQDYFFNDSPLIEKD